MSSSGSAHGALHDENFIADKEHIRMTARFVPTSRLSNIIQMIMLARQSGILRAIRGQEAARQMGQVRFVNGQPASVLYGQMVGDNALNALMGWGECMYSFDEYTADNPDVDEYYAPNGGNPYSGNPYNNSPVPPITSSWPTYGYPPAPTNYPPSSPSQYPQSQPNPSYPQYGSGYSQPSSNPGYSGNSMPNGNDPYYRPPQTGSTATSMPGATPYRPEMLDAVPVPVPIAEPIEQLPLDRRERMILLLVNGQRSMLDLVRLTHRNEQEIYAVLHHLALLGLIQFRR
jgi:hypothetical protein